MTKRLREDFNTFYKINNLEKNDIKRIIKQYRYILLVI